MLDTAVRDRARTLIVERMKARDQQLNSSLQRLAGRVERTEADDQDKLLRLAVRLRLICEQDLHSRAQIIWGCLRSAHGDIVRTRVRGLHASFKEELTTYMREGGIHLAAAMRDQAEALKPIFASRSAVDAGWLALQRDRAAEQMGKSIDQYVAALSPGLGARVKQWVTGR